MQTNLSKELRKQKTRRQVPLHMMMLAPLFFVVLYKYVPMAGIVIAFQKFVPAKGLFGDQKWIGFGNFQYVFKMPNFLTVLGNSIEIAVMKILAGLVVPITLALLLNEVRNIGVKRTVQTLVYMPHFLSWIILGGVLIDILSPSSGLVNRFLGVFNIDPIYFLGSNMWFQPTLILTNVWKEVGFQTIIYLAAITSVNPSLYESAIIDGANRFQRAMKITLPGMAMVIVLLTVLSLGNVLNAGFDQIFNLYNPQVYASGDIIDTLVYRIGLINAQYGLATAIGLFKAVVSLLLISVSYLMAYKVANYRIF
jgi:putative aldouronate transport system permease protein